jgi:hypothetical protein
LIPFFIYFAFSSFLGIGGVKIKEEKSPAGKIYRTSSASPASWLVVVGGPRKSEN